MSKELEIEFKTLLTKDEYIKLCEKFKDCKRNLQINYYFDTSRFTLKASDIGLRVRRLDKDKYIVTLKRKKGMFYKKLMKILTKKLLINFYQQVLYLLKKFQKDLEDVIKGQLLVNYMSLSTYRIGFPYKKGQLAIDKCKYVDTVDYELEYEATSYEAGKREFVEIVREFGITYKKSQPKIKRAYDALRKKI